MLDQTGSEVLIEGGVHLSKIGLMRCGREVAGALPSGTEISNGIREQEPKSVLELEKTSGHSQRTSPSSSIAAGVHSGLCKSKVISRRCLGRRCQTRRNETVCLGVKLSSRAGEGEAVAAAAAREGSEMVATSGAFAGGETVGALFVLWKTAMGARINGA